ncbi:LysR family transcriptional regulator [Shewanella woodyi]|uniref:Transcriptional regulator, LysR family n=1 Tax=Shewanella woodyi (strain ATCC 51908 / MS32) TaxID=392500 RepID=B1KNW2_SHEWM|nr:LysR family transcriptional regulator [Shewanella woodyi]ACA87570.1 transcriptional regulator, LysR family [Shewanella woodyi ATCC 51908]
MSQEKPLDLNLLRVFSIVCKTASFSRAAEELNLTQSSVSNAIARLKLSIGEELFIRVGRGVKPTSVALNLYQQLEQPLLAIEQVVSGLHLFDPKQSKRSFYVYANETIIQLLQTRVDEYLCDSAIDIVFRETPIGEEQIQMDLQLEKVDLALDITQPHLASFASTKVMQDRLNCVVRKEHPRIQGSLSTEQYFAEKHIIHNMRRSNLSMADLMTKEVLPKREMYGEQSSLLNMLATAAKSNAIAVATQSYTDAYAELFGLQVLPLPFVTEPIDLYMVWCKKLQHNAANLWLRETLLLLIKSS